MVFNKKNNFKKLIILFLFLVGFNFNLFAQVNHGLGTKSPTEKVDMNGIVRIREFPKDRATNSIYTKADGTKSDLKDQTFNAKNTVVVDENGVLGVVEGLPATSTPDIKTITYSTTNAIINDTVMQGSLLTLGNLAVYFESTSTLGHGWVRFCLLNGVNDNVVVNQIKVGSGGLYGGNETFFGVYSNPNTTLAAIKQSIPAYNPNNQPNIDQQIWKKTVRETPSINNRDFIQYVFTLINTQEVYRLSAVYNSAINVDVNHPIASERYVTFFLERLTN